VKKDTSIWDNMRLDGYAALVTGAGKGLGRSIAVGLAQAGANVALLSRTAKDLEVLADEVRQEGVEALTIVADVTNSGQVNDAVQNIVKRFGRLDVLVHSAGSSKPKKTVLN
jgi:NAD(P)-dependent dehydrogenase (short-subunit alcohol dehydrogenase family)